MTDTMFILLSVTGAMTFGFLCYIIFEQNMKIEKLTQENKRLAKVIEKIVDDNTFPILDIDPKDGKATWVGNK